MCTTNKKRIIFLIILSCITFMIACNGKPDLTEGKTGKQIIKESYQKASELNNYDMTIDMNMEMEPIGQEKLIMSIKGTGTIFLDPMKMKMEMKMDMTQQEETLNMQQYLEQTNEGAVVYQKADGEWYKIVMEDPSFSELVGMDPVESLKLFMDNLKEVEIIEDEKVNGKDTLKIKLVASEEMYQELMKDNPALSMSGAMPFEMGNVMSEIGDVEYLIWVDKSTLEPVKYYMDLTDNMRNMGKALAKTNLMPEDALKMFESMVLTMDMQLSNLNKAKDFDIPEEAKSAQEIPQTYE